MIVLSSLKPKEWPSLEQVFQRHGFWVLLVRINKFIRCSCYNHESGSAQSDCPECFGQGWPYQEIKRCLVIEEVASVPETLPRIIRTHEVGPVGVAARHFFFLPSARPQPQDLIVLTEFDRYHRPVSRDMEFYEIGHVTSYRVSSGRIVAWRVSAQADPVNVPLKSKAIRSKFFKQRVTEHGNSATIKP